MARTQTATSKKPTPKKSVSSVTPKKPATQSTKQLSSRERLEQIGAELICAFVAEGHSLREWCRLHSFAHNTVGGWLDEDEARCDQYARARQARADKLAEEILAISDDGSNDTYVDDDGKPRTDHDVVARSRLRVDSRKWLASKMYPKMYGDRQILAGDPEAPLGGVKIDLSQLSDTELHTYLALQRKIEGGTK